MGRMGKDWQKYNKQRSLLVQSKHIHGITLVNRRETILRTEYTCTYLGTLCGYLLSIYIMDT